MTRKYKSMTRNMTRSTANIIVKLYKAIELIMCKYTKV